jgi:hypothetical protein
MMQTLGLLGVPVVGEPLPGADLRNEGENNPAAQLNPKGFYEIGGIVMRGIPSDDYAMFDGCAIKIIVSGLVEFGYLGRKVGTNREILNRSKIIWCLRNPRSVAKSQKNLQTNVQLNVDGKFQHANKFFAENPERYVDEIGLFYKWLKENEAIFKNVLIVDYDNMLKDPEEQIDNVINHIGLTVSNTQRLAAIKNVDPSLYRSDKDFEWTDNLKDVGLLADDLYLSIKTGSYDVLRKIQEQSDKKLSDLIHWVDNEELGTWLLVSASLFRSLKSNTNHVRDKLCKLYKHTQKPTACTDYSISDEKYIIQRPKDLGDLTRSKIKCKNAATPITIEECWKCWERKHNGNKKS